MTGLPYPLDFRPGFGSSPMKDIGWALSRREDEFQRLTFAAMAMGGVNLAGWQAPSHDPPVAWEVTNHPFARMGIPMIAYPQMRHGQLQPLSHLRPGDGSARYLDPEPVILPAEPGRRRCEHGNTFDCPECRDVVAELAAEAEA